MGGRFKDKVVFVTGGANGIGREIVKSFYKDGATMIFCDNDTHNASKLTSEYDVQFYPVDVADSKALECLMIELFDTYGDIDIIINNVGVSEFTTLTECSTEQFDRVVNINLRSAFITSRAIAQYRNTPDGKNRYGRIINISSSRHLQSEPNSDLINGENIMIDGGMTKKMIYK